MAATFPDDPKGLIFQAAFGANLSTDPGDLDDDDWTTLTPDYVKSKVVVEVGQTGEAGTAPPMRMRFALRNVDGIFSPHNITGPYYGKLRENTPVRLRVALDSGTSSVGFGYIPSWPVRWRGPGIDEVIETTAQGALLRAQRVVGVKSAMRRTIELTDPLGYWPLEDESTSSVGMSLVSGQPDMIGDDVDFGTVTTLPGTLQSPGLSGDGTTGASLTGRVFGVSATKWSIAFALDAEEMEDPYVLLHIGSGTFGTLDFTPPSSLDNHFYLGSTDPDGLTIIGGALQIDVPTGWEPGWHHYVIALEQSGSDVARSVYIDDELAASDTYTATLGPLTKFIVNERLTPQVKSVAQVEVRNDHDTAGGAVFLGHTGEKAGTRFSRLCEQVGLPHFEHTSVGGGVPMGVQRPGTIATLLQECGQSAEGFVGDDPFGRLIFKGADYLMEQASSDASLILDYAAGDIEQLDPDDDDRDALNIAAVTRIGGATSIPVEVTAGRKGSDPETGMGPVADTGISRSLDKDAQAANHASAMVEIGTVDEPRLYVRLNLMTRTNLISAWTSARGVGSRVIVNNPPPQYTGPAPLDTLIVGYRETFDSDTWVVELWLVPSSPYVPFTIAGSDNLGRIAPAATTTDAEYGPGVTSMSVTSPTDDTRLADSATYSTSFPAVAVMAGERVKITAVTGTTKNQTITVTRGLDGVQKTIPSGTAIELYRPGRIALTEVSS